ncbi:EamA family transporter [Streptomyces sp. Isolate_219]|uniref:EamA family transporter n=1 Tax=Streptomyces sp. Isolate_219 TaxID=2950110 RepID=UPI0021C9F917|nr:EamA family transporter [Streptomyces sp. Isolate_219]MCR8575610.1 EamA family transporter [Streptomyces sp. Isolate_219]
MHASSESPAGTSTGSGQGISGSLGDRQSSPALGVRRLRAPGGRGAGLGIALLSALAFGGSGVAAKPLISAGLEPLQVTWLRVAGAALVMLPIAWRHRDLVRRRPALLAGYGLLAVAGVQACYFAALSRIPVGVALLIEYLAPALVLGWVRFVQKRPVTRAAAVGVVLAVGGLACVVEVWSGLSFDAIGLALALGAACCQVGYFVLSDHGSDGDDAVDPLGVIAYGLLIGAVLLTVIARPWGMDWAVLGGGADMNGTQVPAVLLLAWIVLIATVAAYLTGVVSIRRLSPQVAGVVACLEAVIATVLAWVLLGEHLSAPQIVGGAVVLAGAFIAQSAKPKATETVRVAGAGTGTGDGAGAPGGSGYPDLATPASAPRTGDDLSAGSCAT